MNSVGIQKAPANLAWAQQCRPGTWHPKETTWERWGGGQIPSGVKGAALSSPGCLCFFAKSIGGRRRAVPLSLGLRIRDAGLRMLNPGRPRQTGQRVPPQRTGGTFHPAVWTICPCAFRSVGKCFS